MLFLMKSSIAFLLAISLVTPSAFAIGTSTGTTMLPSTVPASVTKVVETTLSTGTGDTTIAQWEVSSALGKLIQIYEKRVTRLQDEVNRLRIENDDLRAKLAINGSGTITNVTVTPVVTPTPLTPLPAVPKTEQEKRYDAIISNVVTSLPDLLKKNSITASGSIGLFEFIEPKAFFISIDDGKNPAGVTAFKTKILFEYDSNFNAKVLGVFDLDYGSQKYVTLKGGNPYAGIVRVRVKNPNYSGKLLEEIATSSGGTLSGNVTVVTTPRPTDTVPATSTGAITPPVITNVNVSVDDVRKAYDKNKLGDAIELANAVLAKTPTNVEVLTMRARSQYIFSKFDLALDDISTIYKVQGETIDCGIVNDGARAEKALKGARGAVFGTLQTTKCKK